MGERFGPLLTVCRLLRSVSTMWKRRQSLSFQLIAFAVIVMVCSQLWTLISVFAGIVPTPKNDEERAYILATSTPYKVHRVIFASVMLDDGADHPGGCLHRRSVGRWMANILKMAEGRNPGRASDQAPRRTRAAGSGARRAGATGVSGRTHQRAPLRLRGALCGAADAGMRTAPWHKTESTAAAGAARGTPKRLPGSVKWSTCNDTFRTN